MTEQVHETDKNSPFFEAGVDQTRCLAAGLLMWKASETVDQGYGNMFTWQRRVTQIGALGPIHGAAVLRILNTQILASLDITPETVFTDIVSYCRENRINVPLPQPARR